MHVPTDESLTRRLLVPRRSEPGTEVDRYGSPEHDAMPTSDRAFYPREGDLTGTLGATGPLDDNDRRLECSLDHKFHLT